MRKKKGLGSDDFDITEDADRLPPEYEGEGVSLSEDEMSGDRSGDRSVAVWQRIEVRMEELRLRAALCDWDDLDEDYPLRH